MSHASESFCESQPLLFELGSWNSQDKLVFARQFQWRNQIEGNATVSYTSESLCESQYFFFKLGLWNSQDKLVFARQFQKPNQIEGNINVSHASESLCESQSLFFKLGIWNSQDKLVFARWFKVTPLWVTLVTLIFVYPGSQKFHKNQRLHFSSIYMTPVHKN